MASGSGALWRILVLDKVMRVGASHLPDGISSFIRREERPGLKSVLCLAM